MRLRTYYLSCCVLAHFNTQNSCSVDMKHRRRIDFSFSHFTLSRKTAVLGIPKMPNILNQFQNKRTMSEGHEKERDEKCKGQIKRQQFLLRSVLCCLKPKNLSYLTGKRSAILVLGLGFVSRERSTIGEPPSVTCFDSQRKDTNRFRCW
jgi:hypothetical protein